MLMDYLFRSSQLRTVNRIRRSSGQGIGSKMAKELLETCNQMLNVLVPGMLGSQFCNRCIVTVKTFMLFEDIHKNSVILLSY